MRFLIALIMALLLVPAVALAQDSPPYECDNAFGDCGTPEESGGGGCGCGCGGSILKLFTDLGDTYQYADDYDDDGIEDISDLCPYVRNIDQSDIDGDGFGDACDLCVSVSTEFQLDTDGDGLGDECDDDLDGDLVPNEIDICVDIANPLVDGVQPNVDGDELGDACDPDDDNDGVEDLEDNCPLVANADQIMPAGSTCFADMDNDGIYDHRDNCPTVHNPDLEDADNDGMGDACDPDMDNDGVANENDNCPLVANQDQDDLDRDGLGEPCDPAYCYVVLGDTEHCLDPQGAFRVYTPSIREIQTGDTVRLRLFANRENAPIEYRWIIQQAPSASTSTVENPYGSVRLSTPFEYHYMNDNIATFTPDEPGEYIIRLEATQVWEDEVSGELGLRSEALAFLMVDGPSVAGGCTMAGAPATTGTAGLLILLGLFVARRFRRN